MSGRSIQLEFEGCAPVSGGGEERTSFQFPPTRYQGSKRKVARSIIEGLKHLDYHTVLDAFGGTGAVSHAFKAAGKSVTYNDILAFNHQVGLALIENPTVRLPPESSNSLGRLREGATRDDFISRTFSGIYFTDEENAWLDTAVANVRAMTGRYSRAIAWFALIQAALAKRPYNLFHRRNLYMRTAEVARSFGNKASWDRSFEEHFRRFVLQANAAIFDSGVACAALCGDSLDVQGDFDLVYIDPPYINRNGVGVDYRDFYHFLEGMVRFDDWSGLLDRGSRHLRLARRRDPWSDAATCREKYRRLFDRFRGSILALSYRSDGIPSVDELQSMMADVKRRVRATQDGEYQYALSTRRGTRQVLLVGEG